MRIWDKHNIKYETKTGKMKPVFVYVSSQIDRRKDEQTEGYCE